MSIIRYENPTFPPPICEFPNLVKTTGVEFDTSLVQHFLFLRYSYLFILICQLDLSLFVEPSLTQTKGLKRNIIVLLRTEIYHWNETQFFFKNVRYELFIILMSGRRKLQKGWEPLLYIVYRTFFHLCFYSEILRRSPHKVLTKVYA